jgi:electron transport complex protein RnfA
MSHEFLKLFEIIVAASLINNFVFTRFLGLCIFFGTTKKLSVAIGMSVVFTLVMMISALACWLVFNRIMVPYELTFFRIIIFIGIISVLVQASDTILRKISPDLFRRLGIYLALISTNCIVLAVPIINAEEGRSLVESLAFGLGSGLGFVLALIIMASIRERLDQADVPTPFRGLPISLIVTGMIALAFSGFSGLVK